MSPCGTWRALSVRDECEVGVVSSAEDLHAPIVGDYVGLDM